MEDEIIYHPRPNLDELEKNLMKSRKNAALLEEMTNTEGWKLLKKVLTTELEMIAKAAIEPGFKTVKIYQEKVAIARAIKRILDVVEIIKKRGSGAEQRLASIKKLKKE